MTMIALLTFEPSHCPGCGSKLRPHDRKDWAARCSYSCRCGVHYQRVDEEHARKSAATSGGDLLVWLDR